MLELNRNIKQPQKVKVTFIKDYDCLFFKIPKGLTIDAYYILSKRLLHFLIGNEAYTLPCAEEYFEIKER